jgi:hypothetical protein
MELAHFHPVGVEVGDKLADEPAYLVQRVGRVRRAR